MYSIFPPPSKPPKKNYIQENIKQLQNLQNQQRQSVVTCKPFKNKVSSTFRPVPKLNVESKPTKSCTKLASKSDTNILKTKGLNIKTNKEHSKNVTAGGVSSPKLTKDAECQYLESDSRYYFADGSTVHFIYPSETKSSRQRTNVRNMMRSNSIYFRSTESSRRKLSNRFLNKNKSESTKVASKSKDADCQYNEFDFADFLKELPEENLCPVRDFREHDVVELVVPKLNLNGLHDGDGSMVNIMQAEKFHKLPTSQRSSPCSDSTPVILNLDKVPSTTSANCSVVPLVDLQLERENIVSTEKTLSRDELVQKLKNQFSRKVSELNHMPMRSDTLRAKTRKIQLEKELMELEKNLKILSHNKGHASNRANS